MRRLTAASAAVLLAASALALTPTAANAAAPTAPSLAAGHKPCGYFIPELPPPPMHHGWYNHCTTDGSHVVILIRRIIGKSYERCVGPGLTDLGGAVNIRDAKYAHKLCHG